MRDPLNSFVWSKLYDRYDELCLGFDGTSKFLTVFEDNRPKKDRELYYQLLNLFSEERRKSITDPVGAYEALLYWKLYSQGTTSTNLNRWLREDASIRKAAKESLLRLFQELPTSLEKNPFMILEQVKWLDEF